jgi:hypothetical protein
MSKAEQLLKSLQFEDSYLEAKGQREEGHIVIDESRQITIPKELQTIAVTGDKNIESVTFDCVRYWDIHDLSTFKIFINYILPNGEEKTFVPNETRTNPDDESVFHFDWKITPDMTQMSGNIVFSIVAEKRDENGDITHRWGSLRSSGAKVEAGIGVSDNNTSVTINLEDKTIIENGIYTASEGYDGLGVVTVNVRTETPTVMLQQKRVEPSEESQTVESDEGYDGLSKVVVEKIPSAYIIPSGSQEFTYNGEFDVKNIEKAKVNVPKPFGTINITANGETNVSDYATANVQVTPNLQEKTVTVNANTTVTPDQTYDGLSKVTVNVSNEEVNIQPEVTRTYTENGKTYSITPDTGYDAVGSASVTVKIPDGSYSVEHSFMSGDGAVSVSGTNIGVTEKTSRPTSGYFITAEGSGSVSAESIARITKAGYISESSKKSETTSASSKKATKYYEIPTEEKAVTPSTSAQDIYPADSKLLSKVTVKAIPNQNNADTVWAEGAVVKIPAGYYSEPVEKSVKTTKRAKTTLTSESVGNSVLKFTASNNQSAGYVVGSDETAVKTVTLSVNGREVSANDGTNNISVFVSSDYIIPSGTKQITSNGKHDVKLSEYVSVNVPIPDGYLKPTGSREITTNGSYDIAQYERVMVDVPIPDGYIKPSGAININTSGDYDVTGYAIAKVTLPASETTASPMEVSSEVAMEVILIKATDIMIGTVYKYTGETGKYKKNKLYILGGK